MRNSGLFGSSKLHAAWSSADSTLVSLVKSLLTNFAKLAFEEAVWTNTDNRHSGKTIAALYGYFEIRHKVKPVRVEIDGVHKL